MNKINELDIESLAISLTEESAYIPVPHGLCIDVRQLSDCLYMFRSLMFPGYFDVTPVPTLLHRFYYTLSHLITSALRMHDTKDDGHVMMLSQSVTEAFLPTLPELRYLLSTDVKATFDGDPAASSYEEVILCYPALKAMTYYRFAHALHQLGVPLLPRAITEVAHSHTGIDIHPGATIGEYFAIDHGTGIVIGETCIIGHHVKLYQGVTLGAKSFKFDSQGNPVNEPRHPILEDNVVVYSNSSILGRITIGHDSIIGGNVWQITSLPPYSRVVQGQSAVSDCMD